MQTLYCSGAVHPAMNRSEDMTVAFNDSVRSNVTEQWTADPTVERRATEAVYLVVRYYVYQKVTPAIMLLGIVGNLLSLVLGVRCRPHMSSLERSASAGLVALVTSDLMFCAVGLPQLLVPERWNPATPPENIPLARFRFYYELYRGPLHNVFLLCSTWIVAIITTERYVVVSWPIRARLLMIRLHRTIFFYVGVFGLSGVVVLPLFLKYQAVEGDCFLGCRCLYVLPTSTFGSVESRRVYNAVWMLVGVVLPLGCLLVAGTKLVQTLRELRRRNEIDTTRHGRRRRYQSRPSPVTTTVVGTAVSFIVLVCPSIVVEWNKLGLPTKRSVHPSFPICLLLTRTSCRVPP